MSEPRGDRYCCEVEESAGVAVTSGDSPRANESASAMVASPLGRGVVRGGVAPLTHFGVLGDEEEEEA